ncbi:probable pectinesterase/pectinesterase inhibitor [Chenopodium quinoa]|uniref:probable pectinesterase/pectinesterase inhibitor n=1 Tax=Chenopodium quinoa TaxID=63459 RepID=UPI000B78DB9C|nr:probable pectinesterase/pectinesterase inhibitor [Chenopodium quinoa]
MGGKVVVSVISIILVVGVVIGLVAVVHRDKGDSHKEGGKDDENLSSSMKTVNALCGPTTYKDSCIKNLGSVAQNQSATPHDYVKAGVKLALEEIARATNLTDTLVPKANATKKPEMANMAIESCKNLFDLAIDRLDGALDQVHDPNIYKDKGLVWSLRLWLTDVVTFSTSCADEFGEAEAPDLQKIMQDGVVNATEVTISMLDIVTTFNEALAGLDLSINATNLVQQVKTGDSLDVNNIPTNKRHLLGMAIDGEGNPTWLSSLDRRLLSDGNKGSKKTSGKGGKKSKGKGIKKGKGVAAGAGVAAATGAIAAPAIVPGMKPNAIVAQDGSGQFKTIVDALKTHPGEVQGRFVIYVKAGIYKEDVLIGKQHNNVFMYGDGPTKTVVMGDKSFAKGVQTSKTAPFQVEGFGFLCKDMGFQNTAGPQGHQAVALRVNGLQAVFQNCFFDGYQDTLYVQGGSQFFRDCQISGTVDFIFGNGASLIQNSKIIARRGNPGQQNLVTAQGGIAANEATGIVIQGCEILAGTDLFPERLKVATYLGRPWKPYAKTVFMETVMGDLIQPAGYFSWQSPEGKNNHLTAFYGEYANRGPGSNTAMRVKWPQVKVLDKTTAQRYSAATFLAGAPWVKVAGVPISLNVA